VKSINAIRLIWAGITLLLAPIQGVVAITLNEYLLQPAEKSVTSGSMTFPFGVRSYAMEVESFEVGEPAAAKRYSIATDVLGPPDFDAEADTGATTLGCRGVITLRFAPGLLRSIDGPDLYLFDISKSRERIQVAISNDNRRWIEIATVSGSYEAIPVDFFDQVPYGEMFEFVRLTDLGDKCEDKYPGADIDAVGAVGISLGLDSRPGSILVATPAWGGALHSWWLTEVNTGVTEVVVVGDSTAVVRAGAYRLTWVQDEQGVSQVELPQKIIIHPGRMTVVNLDTGIKDTKDTKLSSTLIPDEMISWCTDSTCICYVADNGKIEYMGPHVTSSLRYGESGILETVTLIDCESAEQPNNCTWFYFDLLDRTRVVGSLINGEFGRLVKDGEIASTQLNDRQEPRFVRMILEASEAQCQLMMRNFQ